MSVSKTELLRVLKETRKIADERYTLPETLTAEEISSVWLNPPAEPEENTESGGE